MRDPYISVIMPVYNAERYVAEAVESILAQTFTDFEFLIVDDGSTDGSLKILERYAKTDQRIQLTSTANRGIVAALNSQLAIAGGKYIARMDADDIAHPDRLAKQCAHMESNPACSVLGTSVTVIAPDGLELCVEDKSKLSAHLDILNLLLIGDGSAIRHPSAMLRGDTARELGYREKYKYVEDIDLYLRMSEFGELHNLSAILLSYRLHLASTNARKYAKQNELRRQCVDEWCLRTDNVVPQEMAPPMQAKSKHDFYRRIGWAALRHRKRLAAFRYGLHSLAYNPLAVETFRLLACSIRGR